MDEDMNFFDLCVVIGQAIGRGCKALWNGLLCMIRRTYLYWWVVVPVLVIGLSAALYISRPENLCYKMNAVAQLNGPTVQQFEQAYTPLRTGFLPDDAAITAFVGGRTVKRFDTYRVIDCLDDGFADYIDFKRKSKPFDTLNVQMQDRLCLQFRMKKRDMYALPQIEQALLDYLNSNAPMQKSYATYLTNLQDEVAFNHRQALKLDSLTSAYYFYNASESMPSTTGVNFYGDRRIRLFLDEIYEQQEHLQQGDYKAQLATAPVTLENHFTAAPNPVNGRNKMLILFLILGWIAGCMLAELIDKRQTIRAWLRGE